MVFLKKRNPIGNRFNDFLKPLKRLIEWGSARSHHIEMWCWHNGIP